MAVIITNVRKINVTHVVHFFECFVYIKGESIVRLGKRRRAYRSDKTTFIQQRGIRDAFIN